MYPNSNGAVPSINYVGAGMIGGCNSASNGPNQAIEKRQTIHDALDSSEHLTTELHGVISALEERLACVLEPVQPAPAATDRSSPASPNVMDRIIHQRIMTGAACSRLQDILRRTQL